MHARIDDDRGRALQACRRFVQLVALACEREDRFRVRPCGSDAFSHG